MFDAIKNYILQNWALLLVLPAFVIMLKTSVFFDKVAVRRTYILIGSVFALSIIVFVEFYLESLGEYVLPRTILMAIRYSATPFILAHIMFTLVKRESFLVYTPAAILAIIDIVSIFTGIVFRIKDDGTFIRGPLGYPPFIVAGLYEVLLFVLLILRSNKRLMEIVPIIFLSFAFAAGSAFPFIFGKAFSQIFCTTIALSLFAYYIFSILQMTKKDPLTGLLNRQAYYSDVANDPKDIKGIVSLDMNGLKAINDTEGHAAGDEALLTLGLCFLRASRRNQSVYRIGGDEFLIVCRKNTKEQIAQLVERVLKYVQETKFNCSAGYSYCGDGSMPINDLLKASDYMMYREKAKYYENHSKQEAGKKE